MIVNHPKELFELVKNYGSTEPSRLGPTREIVGAGVRVSSAYLLRREGFSRKLALVEALQFLAGTFDVEQIKVAAPKADHSLFTPQMAYGPRAADEMYRAYRELSETPDSRRAVVFIAKDEDYLDRSNQPCTTTIQFLRRDKVDAVVSMRSWDLAKGMPYDLALFCIVTQAMAKCFDAEAGHVTVVAGSAHIYEGEYNKSPDLGRGYILLNDDWPSTWTTIQMHAKHLLELFPWTNTGGVPPTILATS